MLSLIRNTSSVELRAKQEINVEPVTKKKSTFTILALVLFKYNEYNPCDL